MVLLSKTYCLPSSPFQKQAMSSLPTGDNIQASLYFRLLPKALHCALCMSIFNMSLCRWRKSYLCTGNGKLLSRIALLVLYHFASFRAFLLFPSSFFFLLKDLSFICVIVSLTSQISSHLIAGHSILLAYYSLNVPRCFNWTYVLTCYGEESISSLK